MTKHDLCKAIHIHRPRVQMAAAMETGCAVQAKSLANLVLERASKRLSRKSLGKGMSAYLLREVRTTAATWRADGVLA